MPASYIDPANPFNRPIAFRFYFRNWKSGYTAYARHFSDALAEVTEHLSHCGPNPNHGPIDLFINGKPASESTQNAEAAQAA